MLTLIINYYTHESVEKQYLSYLTTLLESTLEFAIDLVTVVYPLN